MTDPVNTERPTEPLAQKAPRLEADQPKPTTARAELLQLMADWGLKTGHGSREHADRILNRHAHELAEQIRNSEELRAATDDHMGDCLMAADLIDPEAGP
ncbi:hypothetical protein [Streptomyces sp. NPDC056188]|uniref:hypothetical protein n=1 Tax=Streptomyces sp. NPDC056188 TaxID=3345740 RepID=UPI0035E1B1D7